MNNPSEHAEQVTFINWFESEYPGVRIFAIPNGGKRNKREAFRLKQEGVKRGVPDLYIPGWKLWIEMKRVEGGTLSPQQKDWIDYLQSIGDSVIVTYGCGDAVKKVEEWKS